jgi:hypothetical protein
MTNASYPGCADVNVHGDVLASAALKQVQFDDRLLKETVGIKEASSVHYRSNHTIIWILYNNNYW